MTVGERALGEPLIVELPGARATFTTRHGGVSQGPYRSLNLGRLTDDDPDAVRRNRELVTERIGMPLAMIRQVHAAEVRRLVQRPRTGEPLPEADGQATATAGVAPMVLTADCLPIAVAGGGAAAILHAGWRGLAAGVIEAGVDAIRELGEGGRLEAVIGPGAGPCCYEVGEDVHATFASYGPAARRGRNLDLKSIARIQLERAGVDAVGDVGLCTICSEEFFSHRRDRGITGRQAGIVWLN
ncbi:MAG TPA: polyphenol oxidase family protein [Solirubrobacteraceae bacterium]